MRGYSISFKVCGYCSFFIKRPFYQFTINSQSTTVMITALYGDIRKIPDDNIDLYLQLLPGSMRAEVLKYKYTSDRKARILARLMLLRSMKDSGSECLLENWQRDKYHKPFIEGWDAFNISHSGDLVVFCHALYPVGIDIEERLPVSYNEMLHYFHPAEKDFIMRSGNIRKSFYRVWARKEAFLKAIGLGIVNGLKAFNCIEQSTRYQEKDWYYYELPFNPSYSCYLCSPYQENKSSIKISEVTLHFPLKKSTAHGLFSSSI